MTGYPGPVHRWRPGHAMTNSGARAAQPPAGGAALAGRLAAGRGQSQDSCTQAATQSRVQVRTKETSDTNGRVTATDPVNTAVPDLQQEFTQA